MFKYLEMIFSRNSTKAITSRKRTTLTLPGQKVSSRTLTKVPQRYQQQLSSVCVVTSLYIYYTI